jgi:hypothetical protein
VGGLLALASWAGLAAAPAAAQATTITPATPEYLYAEEIVFRALVTPTQSVQTVTVFLQAEGEALSRSTPAQLSPDGEASARYDLSENRLPSFAEIRYWFEAALTDGSRIESDSYTFRYTDNRFEWQTRQQPPLTVHWYEGEAGFGQNLLETATAGLETSRALLELPTPEAIEIYVYANAADLQATLDVFNAQDWVAGHADPATGVMVVSLPAGPDQRLEMERQIPHELMHILLARRLGEGYQRLPAWFNEGLASIVELYPNPDYVILLENARQRNATLPMSSLCGAFPRDVAGTLLGYAQSASFTRYLQAQAGPEGLQRLLEAYASGLDCEAGVQTALGSSLAQLEQAWRAESLGENPAQAAAQNLAPWLVVGLVALGAPFALMIASLFIRRKQSTPV